MIPVGGQTFHRDPTRLVFQVRENRESNTVWREWVGGCFVRALASKIQQKKVLEGVEKKKGLVTTSAFMGTPLEGREAKP